MNSIIQALKNNPVRIYSIITAVVAVAVAFGVHVSSTEQEAILGLITAILWGGEVVRSVVTPTSKVTPVVDVPVPQKNL